MKQRYNRGMEGIHPSPAFLNHLELEMNRTLRSSRRHTAAKIAMSAALLSALLLGAFFLRTPVQDRVAARTPLQPGDTSPAPSPTGKVAARIAPTDAPTPMPTPTTQVASTEAPMAMPTPTASETEIPFEWLMRGGAWPSFPLEMYDTLTMNLADRAYSIRSDASPDSPVVFTLQPGEAWWPADDDPERVNDSGSVCALYWDGESLRKGWINLDEGAPVDPLPYTVKKLPGRLREDTPLRYARDESALAVAEMNKDDLVYVYARMGNWVYVTDHGFDEERVRMGWLPVDSLYLLAWRDPAPLGSVELLADGVNLRETPGGKVFATLSREDASALRYEGRTVEIKGERWHLVTFKTKKQYVGGYIAADYANVAVITLGEELNLDDVVSAELCVTQFEGEAVDFQITLLEGTPNLKALCERLKTASSATPYNDICCPGVAMITLTFDGGGQETLMLSGDSCTYLEYNGMVYNYRTPAEQSEAFLNDGGASSEDILPQYFEGYLDWSDDHE